MDTDFLTDDFLLGIKTILNLDKNVILSKCKNLQITETQKEELQKLALLNRGLREKFNEDYTIQKANIYWPYEILKKYFDI
jgi:hypothetical protein